MKSKLCSYVKTKTITTTRMLKLMTTTTRKLKSTNNPLEKRNTLSAFPIPAFNTHLNFTKKRSPVMFADKFSPKNQSLGQCVCDPETFASDNPWILVGIGGGLLVAIALSVTACCW